MTLVIDHHIHIMIGKQLGNPLSGGDLGVLGHDYLCVNVGFNGGILAFYGADVDII